MGRVRMPSRGLPVTTGESQEPHLCTDVRTGAAEAAQAAFPVLPSDSITRPSTTIRETSIESVPVSGSKAAPLRWTSWSENGDSPR